MPQRSNPSASACVLMSAAFTAQELRAAWWRPTRASVSGTGARAAHQPVGARPDTPEGQPGGGWFPVEVPVRPCEVLSALQQRTLTYRQRRGVLRLPDDWASRRSQAVVVEATVQQLVADALHRRRVPRVAIVPHRGDR